MSSWGFTMSPGWYDRGRCCNHFSSFKVVSFVLGPGGLRSIPFLELGPFIPFDEEIVITTYIGVRRYRLYHIAMPLPPSEVWGRL